MNIGFIEIQGVRLKTLVIKFKNANLILVEAPRGFIMCGYLNIQTAEKMQDIACIVTGVSTVDELLDKPIAQLTSYAQNLGIIPGMIAREALKKML